MSGSNANREPPCHNRPERDQGWWYRNGHRPSDLKPLLRWQRRWFTDRCAAYDTDPSTVPVPVAENWLCAGCRWMPVRVTP